jgi:4-amino-4-deoxychorismate lyase
MSGVSTSYDPGVSPLYVLVNGLETDCLPVHDRGLHYGDGLFETVVIRDHRPALWARHLERLFHGCQRLGMPVPDRSTLEHEVSLACRRLPQGVLKVLITRGAGGRGYRPPQQPAPNRVILLYARAEAPQAAGREGVDLRICSTRLGINPALAGLKHLNRLEQVTARSEWCDPAVPEGLMLDVQGRVIEGTMSNLFLVRDGAVLTPSLIEAGVAGIMRDLIMNWVRGHSIPLAVTELDLDSTFAADELFVCNTVIGIWPVRSLGDTRYAVGPITRWLARRAARFVS